MSFNAEKYIEVIEQSSMGTPSTGRGRFYFKDDGLPYVIDDNGTEQEISTGGSASLTKEINQTSHGFVVGDVIRFDGADYVKAKADSATNAEVLGIVSTVVGVDDFIVSLGGFATLAGKSFTPGDTMFLSAATAGLMTTAEPTEAGEVVKPVFVCTSTTTGYLVNWRGNVIAYGVVSSGSTGGTATSIFGTFGGNESQGAVSLSGATNVSSVDDSNRVGFIQASSFNDNGNTLTVDTGLLFMGVSGTCTISGTIDADAQGGTGGEHGTSSGSEGYAGARGDGIEFGDTDPGSTSIRRGGTPGGYIGDTTTAEEQTLSQFMIDTSLGGAGGGGGYQGGASQIKGGAGGGAGANGGYSASASTADATATSANKILILTGGAGDNSTIGYSGLLPIVANSFGAGGGGGSGGGGAGQQTGGLGGTGGGVIYIECDELVFSGTLTADGEAGGTGGGESGSGGGGGGGCIIVRCNTLTTNSGTVTVTAGAGGVGGTSAGAGADGFKNIGALTSA